MQKGKEIVLEVKELTKQIDRTILVDHLNFSLERGGYLWVSGREWSRENYNAPYDDTPYFPNIRRCSDPWALNQNRYTGGALP